MKKKCFSNALVKAVDFISQLTPLFFDLLGYPQIEVHSDYVDVRFKTSNTIRDLNLLKYTCDELRIFADGSDVVIVYTFNSDDF